jgi:hypothetical protein
LPYVDVVGYATGVPNPSVRSHDVTTLPLSVMTSVPTHGMFGETRASALAVAGSTSTTVPTTRAAAGQSFAVFWPADYGFAMYVRPGVIRTWRRLGKSDTWMIPALTRTSVPSQRSAVSQNVPRTVADA